METPLIAANSVISAIICDTVLPNFPLADATVGAVPGHKPERIKAKPQQLLLDKGYDYKEVRAILQVHGLIAHIRSCGEETKDERNHLARRPAAGWSSAPMLG